ncbi:hypothetical protein EGW08_012362 [Elysia chlorotica]|uniref:RHD domain-containing protein n=1 Tax=Elysia chlorotica TaxID=188477 RepID=A0A3S0ZPQ5_ELYCH|nr:hypothetical protein EGW08_012362 [Elysia chlorotica]
MKPGPKTRQKGLAPINDNVGSKICAKDLTSEDLLKMTSLVPAHPSVSVKPSVQIVKCISFQKFRYSGENRPGKKYQEKEFMTLQLNNLAEKVVRVIIICTDADNRELIHPNGLVGKDCHHGIYDKDYVVSRSTFLIKIPYLRTERIKINAKKDEHKNIIQANNIQAVLSQRASHLPTPYKERCLSQCTDKYTSARKFDTTKVCLGVIITVQSQGGEYNGSLHAISHMVRNASEKTSLEIFKLSHTDVPAWHGKEIDIFTNEDGPAIEPDKCLVYVTLCDVPGAEEWKSDIFSPSGEDILYKKVIRYKVPPIAPNYDISSPVSALLHLECPQSNQYCNKEFKYTPLDTGYVCIDNLSPGNSKRPFEELDSYEDVKPIVKKVRVKEEESNASIETVKANLKSKLRARQENYHSDDQQNEDLVGANGDGDHFIVDPRYSQQQKGLPMYTEQQHVFIRHDPQTGEASYLLDMDASKKGRSNHGSPFEAHSQGVKVVAAGYSDAVPPNTTVLIYTTNNEGTEQVISEADAEHMIVENSAFMHASEVEYRGKENRQEMGAEEIAGASSNSLSEQIIRREAIGFEKMHESPGSTVAVYKAVQELDGVSKDNISSLQPFSYVLAPSSNSLLTSNCSVSIDKTSSSAIPEIRRMVIPSKQISETSPWEVGSAEDAEAYSMCVEAVHYKQEREASQVVGMKMELASSAIPPSGTGNDSSFNVSGENKKQSTVLSQAKNSVGKPPKPMGLNSYLEGAIANNLPTLEVSQIADSFVNALDQVDGDGE